MSELCHLPAHELVKLMSTRRVSCRVVIEAHLARIDAVYPALNALVEAADPQTSLDAARDADDRAARGDPLGRAHGLPVVAKDVMHGRTMELLWESVFLGGDRGRGFTDDLLAIGATDPSEELAEFLKQAQKVHFSLSTARSRFADIDTCRIEMLTFMTDYDLIICPAMPTPAKEHHHGLVEINDFSHLMVHNLTGRPAAVVRCGTASSGLPIGVQIVARPWQDAVALAVAGHLEKVFGGWRPPAVA